MVPNPWAASTGPQTGKKLCRKMDHVNKEQCVNVCALVNETVTVKFFGPSKKVVKCYIKYMPFTIDDL